MLFSRRRLAALALALPGLCALPAFAQGTYPERPVKLIVPFAPGGSTDLVARLVADRMQATLGQPVVVDNRAGGGGMIGSEAVARADADGYTVGIGTVSTLTVNPLLLKANRVDPLKDLAPIALLATVPAVFMVHPSFPGRSFEQVVAELRARPDAYNMGSSGPGSISHLLIEAMNVDLKFKLRHIPYRGMGPALTAALAGETQVSSDQYPSSAAYIKSGKLLPFAVGAHRRLDALPSVPTLAELGQPELNALAMTWFGLVAPAKTPPAIQKKLQDAATAALRDPALLARLKELGMEAAGGTPEAFRAQIESGLARNRRIVEAAGIRPE
ncbi:Bug family tripartite tricarboxylate transporter substrate binding protein [Variovorax sp. CY25R-8]|uniref:Bug family tripartite tricarboxylate transporter substrate binding protein n=1 Tax=Variovorax sp. CY25R-8 TaxID=2855501 RepID=UPI0021BB785F|nr:tripartite tricarboxylate transporter substrate binding protein [Variovorax sp. CY25R-8]MCT8176946.1 tripartite tricarboxylate transporter substrate binding protein [Variovorax sp. CY25R-8]